MAALSSSMAISSVQQLQARRPAARQAAAFMPVRLAGWQVAPGAPPLRRHAARPERRQNGAACGARQNARGAAADGAPAPGARPSPPHRPRSLPPASRPQVRAAQSLQGKVVSTAQSKTAVVEVATLQIHPVYQVRPPPAAAAVAARLGWLVRSRAAPCDSQPQQAPAALLQPQRPLHACRMRAVPLLSPPCRCANCRPAAPGRHTGACRRSACA